MVNIKLLFEGDIMIQKTVKETMSRMERILESGAKGDCGLLFGAMSDTAIVCGPVSPRIFGREESIAYEQKPYLNTFSILKYQLTCNESKGPFMIVTGDYKIEMKDGKAVYKQYVSAVWRQVVPGNDVVLEYLDFHTRGCTGTVREERKPKILLTDSEGVMVQAEPEDILFVQSSRNYVNVRLKNGDSLRIKSTLHRMAEKLGSQQFLLFNRGTILNLDAVQKITKDAVIMNDGTNFGVSIKGRTLIRKMLRSRGSQQDRQ